MSANSCALTRHAASTLRAPACILALTLATSALASETLQSAGNLTDLRSSARDTTTLSNTHIAPHARFLEQDTRIDLSSAFGVISRANPGADGPNQSSLSHSFEDLNVLPAPLLNQTTAGLWGGAALVAGVTGRSHFSSAQTAPFSGCVDDMAGGNATKKLRLLSTELRPPGGFFSGYRLNFAKTNFANGMPDVRFLFSANATTPAQLRAECFVNSLSTLWTNEGVNLTSGFIVDRVLWGGTNQDPSNGLPLGPVTHFHNLTPNPYSFTLPIFEPLIFPAGHPNAGAHMSVPVNTWFEILHEARLDGNIGVSINYNDGLGDVHGYTGPAVTAPRFDRFAVNSSFEGVDDAYYVDNVRVSGEEFFLPYPPPLECANGMYLDDLEWLNGGPLFGQGSRWTDAFSAKAVVILDGDQRQTLRQTNVFPDDHYRQENRTTLPITFATPGNPFSICTKVKIPAGNATVRGLSPESLTQDSTLTRLFIGREAPPAPYSNATFVQINPSYDPIDPEGTPTPFDNVPVIGSDVYSTGYNWTFDNVYRNVCVKVSSLSAMTISVGAVTIYTGAAFVSSIDSLAFESENNAAGLNNTMSWDDVHLLCQSLPCLGCGTNFVLVWADGLEWGILGLTIGLHDDDKNPSTPFRWASAANMPIQQGVGSNITKVLRMENLFRDLPPLPPSHPDFTSLTQASSRLPNVVASSTRGWATSGQYMLTDGATTRLWSPGQSTPIPSTFSFTTRLAFSSVTQTLWYTTPNPAFTCPFTPGAPSAITWIDSGTSLSSLAVNFGSFFQLSVHMNFAGNHTFRINGRILRDSASAPIKPMPLSACDGGTLVLSKNLDAIFMSSADDNTASPGSILYADNIRAWALPCLGDTNDDGIVNFTDLNNVLSFFGQSGPNIGGNVAPDADHDGIPDDNLTNFIDLNAVLSGFAVPCV